MLQTRADEGGGLFSIRNNEDERAGLHFVATPMRKTSAVTDSLKGSTKLS